MRWAVLVGGAGSNLRAILESGLPVHLVVSHKTGVGALDIAAAHHVPTVVITRHELPDRGAYDRALVGALEAHQIDRIAMAGFLRWLQPDTITRYAGAIVNLHPSLLPAYPGLHAIDRAFADGVLWTGVSVHFVDEGHDTGPIVAQAPVPRFSDDTLEDLEARIHETEHQLYPAVLQAVDRRHVSLKNGHVDYERGDFAWIHGRYSV